jgi:hypothetical protein
MLPEDKLVARLAAHPDVKKEVSDRRSVYLPISWIKTWLPSVLKTPRGTKGSLVDLLMKEIARQGNVRRERELTLLKDTKAEQETLSLIATKKALPSDPKTDRFGRSLYQEKLNKLCARVFNTPADTRWTSITIIDGRAVGYRDYEHSKGCIAWRQKYGPENTGDVTWLLNNRRAVLVDDVSVELQLIRAAPLAAQRAMLRGENVVVDFDQLRFLVNGRAHGMIGEVKHVARPTLDKV